MLLQTVHDGIFDNGIVVAVCNDQRSTVAAFDGIVSTITDHDRIASIKIVQFSTQNRLDSHSVP